MKATFVLGAFAGAILGSALGGGPGLVAGVLAGGLYGGFVRAVFSGIIGPAVEIVKNALVSLFVGFLVALAGGGFLASYISSQQ